MLSGLKSTDSISEKNHSLIIDMRNQYNVYLQSRNYLNITMKHMNSMIMKLLSLHITLIQIYIKKSDKIELVFSSSEEENKLFFDKIILINTQNIISSYCCNGIEEKMKIYFKKINIKRKKLKYFQVSPFVAEKYILINNKIEVLCNRNFGLKIHVSAVRFCPNPLFIDFYKHFS